MIERYDFDENKKLYDDILKAYYVQHGKGGSSVKLEGGSISFTHREKKHGLQGRGVFDAFTKPLISFLVPSIVKGVSSAVMSKAYGASLKDSLKQGVGVGASDAVLRKGQSLLTNALTGK
jgi:hypothetical protein